MSDITAKRATFVLGCSVCGQRFIGGSTSEQFIGKQTDGWAIDQMGIFLDSMINTIKEDFADLTKHAPGCNRPILALWRDE